MLALLFDVLIAFWATKNKPTRGSAVGVAALLGAVGGVAFNALFLAAPPNVFSEKEVAIQMVIAPFIHAPISAVLALLFWGKWGKKLAPPPATAVRGRPVEFKVQEPPLIPHLVQDVPASSVSRSELPPDMDTPGGISRSESDLLDPLFYLPIERELDALFAEFRLLRSGADAEGFEEARDLGLKIAAEARVEILWNKLCDLDDEDPYVLFLWCKLHCYLVPSVSFNRSRAREDFRKLEVVDPFLHNRAKDLYRVVFAEFWVLPPRNGRSWVILRGVACYFDELWAR